MAAGGWVDGFAPTQWSSVACRPGRRRFRPGHLSRRRLPGSSGDIVSPAGRSAPPVTCATWA